METSDVGDWNQDVQNSEKVVGNEFLRKSGVKEN